MLALEVIDTLRQLVWVLLQGQALYHLSHPAVELTLAHWSTGCLTPLARVLHPIGTDSLKDLSLGCVLCDLVAGEAASIGQTVAVVVVHSFRVRTDKLLKETLHSIHWRYVKALVALFPILFRQAVYCILRLTTPTSTDYDGNLISLH